MEISALNSNYLKTHFLYEQAKKELGQIGNNYSDYKQKVSFEIAELKQQLESFEMMYSAMKKNEKIEALKQSPILQKMEDKLNPRIKNFHLLESDWNDLIVMTKLCLPMFYTKITKNCILSRQELIVTILTRIGYTTSSIAILLDKPVQRITNAKTIANTKLFGDNSARTFAVNIETL